MQTIRLCNGVEVPVLSLGTALNDDRRQAARCVREAVELGYRAIDTAEAYHNHVGIGEGVRDCGVPRGQLYLSSKVWNTHHGYAPTLAAFDEALRELGLDYLDQYLIHWPGRTDRFLETWRALETLYRQGRVRVIGVSNFLKHHLETLLAHAEIPPMVDQLELNPVFVPLDTVGFCRAHQIQVEATRPICWGRVDRLEPVCRIAAKYGKTPPQVAIRWHLQKGVRPLPKSVHRARMAQNIDVFDFRLTGSEMEAIDALNTGVRETGQDPDTFWMLDTDFQAENERIMGASARPDAP